jgi:hypothetical protein
MKKHLLISSLMGLFIAALPAMGQSTTSGDLAGVLTDATGAAIPSAQIKVTNVATGESKTVSSSSNGDFRASLLTPGSYKVSATASGFATTENTVVVSAGTVTQDNLKLSIGQQGTTVEVSGAAELVNTTNADVTTTFSAEEVRAMPNPGNDLTFVAQTAPGTVMNTGTAAGGYGNFSSFGISGLSNMFTLDGGYENDPFLNLNNTGASNLTLGNNEVDTVTVIAPAYSAQFGGLGGAQVNEITTAGGNHVHGNASYYWDGRALNANDYFNKQQEAFNGTPNLPTFVNANQWGASIGGPAIKDRLFWFVNTEGIRAVTPQQSTVYAPNAALQSCITGADPGGTRTVAGYGLANGTPGADSVTYASCANLNAAADAGTAAAINNPDGPSSNPSGLGALGDGLPFHAAPASQLAQMKRVFDTYNNSPYRPGAGSVHQDRFDPTLVTYFGGSSALLTEWLLTARVDYRIGNKDNFFIHYKQDHGVQPTYTDTISPLFTDQSPQPAWEGQINETHTFTQNLTNQLIVTGNYYSAPFKNANPQAAVIAAAPSTFLFLSSDAQNGANGTYGGINYAFPEGRNVAGYQVIDDISWTKGRNTLRGGYNIRRDNITDSLQPRSVEPLTEGYAEDFWAGDVDYVHSQYVPVRASQPISVYDEGWYVEDQFKVAPNVTLTAGLRVETNSNIICHTNCFSYLTNNVAFGQTGAAPTSTPYNSLITASQRKVFKDFQKFAAMPRVGFNWGVSSKTTVRGGFGMFTDSFPGLIADRLASNVPGDFHAAVYGTQGSATGTDIGYDPGTVGGVQSDGSTLINGYKAATASASVFTTDFFAGRNAVQVASDVAKQNALYSTPSIQTVAPHIKYPTYEEYSLAVEQRIDNKTVISALYVGNHGYHEPVGDATANLTNPSFAGIPTAKPYASFATVTNNYSGASSNYNGVVLSAVRRSKTLSVQFNYQFSKAMDEVSNGGLEAFAPDNGDSASIINPNNLHSNYGPADYNVKHNVTSSFVYEMPSFVRSNNLMRNLTGNFEFSGDVFHQSGLPYSITQSTTGGGVGIPSSFSNGTVQLLAAKLNNNFDHHCGGSTHVENVALGTVDHPCNFTSSFGTPTSFTGGQSRNSLVGPSYTDVNLGAFKTISIPHYEVAKLKLGAQFFNLFNHTNFQNPAHNRASSNSTLGGISSTVGAPTSILGSTGGADASPRLIQLHASLVF